MKKCPKCAEGIKLEALVCRFCGHQFDKTEVAQEISNQETEKYLASLNSNVNSKKDKHSNIISSIWMSKFAVKFFVILGGLFSLLVFFALATSKNQKYSYAEIIVIPLVAFSPFLLVAGFMFKIGKSLEIKKKRIEKEIDELYQAVNKAEPS